MVKTIQRWLIGVFVLIMCVAMVVIVRLTSSLKQQEQIIVLQESVIEGKDALLMAQQQYMNIKAKADSTRTGQESRFFRSYFAQDQLRWLRSYEKYIAKRRSKPTTDAPIGVGGAN